jgi:hypothetical protein
LIDRSFFSSRAFSAIAAFIALIALLPLDSSAELRNRIVLGYDSFIDRFTILEDDTAESVQEFYAGLGNDFLFDRESIDLELRNYFRYGNQTLDDRFDGEISLFPRRRTRIDLRTSIGYKHFQESSDYSFGNDYLQSNTYLRLRRKLGDSSRLTARGRFETVDYENKTDFDYDYYYYDGGIEFESGSLLERMIRVSAHAGERTAPDTTAMSHSRMIGEIEAHISLGRSAILHIASMGDRRHYREKVRSSYWLLLSSGELMLTSISGKSLTFRLESEYTTYDDPTFVYFDTHFVRGSAGARLPFKTRYSIQIEPRIARMICMDFDEERYFEYSILLGLEIFNFNDFWLMAGYEPGYRDYLADENEIYSDFYLNRLSLMSNVPLSEDFYMRLFAMHDPERHTRREDDFSITLFSIDLTRRF